MIEEESPGMLKAANGYDPLHEDRILRTSAVHTLSPKDSMVKEQPYRKPAFSTRNPKVRCASRYGLRMGETVSGLE